MRYLEECLCLTKLTEEFNTEGSEFFFTMLGEEVIGYLKMNPGKRKLNRLKMPWKLNGYTSKKIIRG